MLKTIKVKLKPNNKQANRLLQTAGVARFAYNWALGIEKENYANGGKFIQDGALRKQFTQLKKLPEYSWLNDSSNNATKQAIKDACGAFIRFFKGLTRFPKFKTKRKSKPSFYVDPIKIEFTETHVKLEKLAKSNKRNKTKFNWVRIVEKGRIPADTKYYNPRVTFDGLNWWLSVSVDFQENYAPSLQDGIGIDLGLKKLAITSDRDVYENISKTTKVRKLEKKKRRLQRQISRKYQMNRKGGSYQKTCNIIKSEKKLLKLTRRLTNIRHDHLHQITSELVNRKPKFIALEDLNVRGMMKNKHLAKAIAQQCFYEFRRQIEYKAMWNNFPVVIVERWFPSSKQCFQCGKIKKNLKLSDRIYRCACGHQMDRDLNAALNLKAYGAKQLELCVLAN